MKLPPLTQNQKLVVSFLLSALGAALSAGIAAAGQEYSMAGLNIPILINVGLLAFMACLGPALYNFIPGHIQQIIVAEQDTQAMLQANLKQAQQTHVALTQTVQALSQTVQAQSTPTPTQAQTPLARVESQQIPFPSQQQSLAQAQLDRYAQPQQSVSNPTLTAPQPQYSFTVPARPTPEPQPITFPAVVKPLDVVPGTATGTYLPSTQSQYSDLHFGDSQLIPVVPGQGQQ